MVPKLSSDSGICASSFTKSEPRDPERDQREISSVTSCTERMWKHIQRPWRILNLLTPLSHMRLAQNFSNFKLSTGVRSRSSSSAGSRYLESFTSVETVGAVCTDSLLARQSFQCMLQQTHGYVMQRVMLCRDSSSLSTCTVECKDAIRVDRTSEFTSPRSHCVGHAAERQ